MDHVLDEHSGEIVLIVSHSNTIAPLIDELHGSKRLRAVRTKTTIDRALHRHESPAYRQGQDAAAPLRPPPTGCGGRAAARLTRLRTRPPKPADERERREVARVSSAADRRHRYVDQGIRRQRAVGRERRVGAAELPAAFRDVGIRPLEQRALALLGREPRALVKIPPRAVAARPRAESRRPRPRRSATCRARASESRRGRRPPQRLRRSSPTSSAPTMIATFAV